jgi:hypothetical protein
VDDLIGRDHSRTVERVGHVRGRPQERPADAAVADRLLAGPVHCGSGRVLGRDLRYAEADPADMLAQMVSCGMPQDLADAIAEQFRSALEPYNSEPTGDITTVTSHPPRSFTDWAQAHRTELLTPAGW